MRRGDLLIAGMFLFLGLFAIVEARKFDVAAGYGLGTGFFPFWLGIAVALLGAVILFQIFRQGKKYPKNVPPPALGKKLLVIVVLFAFVFGVGLFGFIFTFSLLVAFLLLCIERETWWRALLISAATGVGFYIFFVRLLDVELPKGLWGF